MGGSEASSPISLKQSTANDFGDSKAISTFLNYLANKTSSGYEQVSEGLNTMTITHNFCVELKKPPLMPREMAQWIACLHGNLSSESLAPTQKV